MNVVFIVLDDIGWADPGFRGGTIETPYIDELSSRAMIFDQFYVQPICTPTRGALMTGKLPYKNGVQQIIWPWSSYGLPLNHKLLPQHLSDHGYDCYAIGKWHLGFHHKEFRPTNRGFKYFYGSYTGWIDQWKYLNNNSYDLVCEDKPAYTKEHSTDAFTNAAISLIEKQDVAKPMFLYLAYTAPHIPHQDYPYFEKINSKTKNATYAAMVTHADFSIGRITASLRKKGMLDDTLIWITGDNGSQFGSNEPWRGAKAEFYEGGIRAMNLLIHKNVTKGINKNLHHVVDMFPTVTDLANLPNPESLDGISVRNPNNERELILHIKKNSNGFVGTIRSGDWKLVKYQGLELYNIKDDPQEKNNVANAFPDKLDKLLSKLLDASNDYIHDEGGSNQWFPPNGFPPGFVKPKIWCNISVPQSLSLAEEEDAYTMRDALGYRNFNG
jgi:arylsulfatase A-like enzyme